MPVRFLISDFRLLIFSHGSANSYLLGNGKKLAGRARKPKRFRKVNNNHNITDAYRQNGGRGGGGGEVGLVVGVEFTAMPSNIHKHGVLLHQCPLYRANLDTKLAKTAEQRKRATDSNLYSAYEGNNT